MLMPLPYEVFQDVELTVDSVQAQRTFAGRLGDRVQETVTAKDASGRQFSIKMPRYHTRFGKQQEFRAGDRIEVRFLGSPSPRFLRKIG